MKIVKRVISCALACVMCVSAISTASAMDVSEVHVLQDTPPTMSIEPYGAKPPTTANGTHNLAKSAYDYTVERVGAQVYTDRWLTGAKSIKCTVDAYEHLDGSVILNYEAVTFSVYNSKNKLVSEAAANLGVWAGQKNGYGSCVVTGLSATEKYYVQISVTSDNILKSFVGEISKRS